MRPHLKRSIRASRTPASQSGFDPAAAGDEDEILGPHQLRDSGHHFRCKPAAQCREDVGIDSVRQEPLAETADGQMGNRRERVVVVRIQNEAGDVVLFVGNDGFIQKYGQGKVGQGHLRRDPFLGRLRRNACQCVARPERRGLGQQCLEIGKVIAN